MKLPGTYLLIIAKGLTKFLGRAKALLLAAKIINVLIEDEP